MRSFFSVLPSLVLLFAACSPSVEKPESQPCGGKAAKTAACSGSGASHTGGDDGGATTLYQAPAPLPVVADAGADARPAATKPDGGRPVIPPPNYACRDLSRCCHSIRSSLERAACVAVVVKGTPSVCTTALIGYQIVGCGHSPISFGGFVSGLPGTNHDLDNDGVPNFVDQDETPSYSYSDYCAMYPEDYSCGGGASAYDTNPCIANPSAPGCAPDPFFPNEPPPPSDPYGSNPYGTDPYASDPYGSNPYGGDPYGSDPYGGDPYAPPANDGSGGSGDDWWW